MKKKKPARGPKRPLGARLRAMFGKRFQAGSYAAFAALVVIAIAVAANLLIGALPESATQLDLTDQAIFTLGDQTKRVVAALDKDVNLYLLAISGNEDETIARLLGRYADLSDHITVTYLDPTQKPAFLNNYSLDISRLYANSVLVESEDRYRLVGYDEIFVSSYSTDYYTYSYSVTTEFDGENALTNAIHYVTSDNLPKVYTLTGHGEATLSETLTDLIARDNLSMESLSLLSLDAVPEDASAVLINAPSSDLSADEAQLLIEYLADGGRVVLLTDVIADGEMENLLSMAQSMGLTLGQGIVIEGDPNMHLNRYPYYLLPDYGDHEITEPLVEGGYYVLEPLAQPILLAEDSEADVTWLLITSDSAYSKVAGLQMTTTEKEDGDMDGPFYVAAAAELGEGRLVWFPSSDLLDEGVDAMVSGANSDLFLNALEWMSGQEETISIRAKSMDGERLTLTSAQSSLWSVVLIGVVPAAFVIIGLVVVIRRKRQ